MCEPEKVKAGRGAESVLAAPFVVVGAAVAVTLVVWVVRTVLPWAVLAGVVYGCWRAVPYVRRARRGLQRRRVVPAPLPAVSRSAVTHVNGRAIGRRHENSPGLEPGLTVSREFQ